MRQRYEAGVPWEPIVGYSRGVRVGDQIHCSGTAPTGPDGSIAAPGDPGEQARQCIRNLRITLEALGGRLEDVVRTRIYVKDISRWEAIGQAPEHFRLGFGGPTNAVHEGLKRIGLVLDELASKAS